MSCELTEYRVLLYAHDSLGRWERWQVGRHLRGCPGCREQLHRFAAERRALAGCLSSRPALRIADRIALELGVPRRSTGPQMVVSRRVPILFLLLAAVLAAGAAVGYVGWRGGPDEVRISRSPPGPLGANGCADEKKGPTTPSGVAPSHSQANHPGAPDTGQAPRKGDTCPPSAAATVGRE